MGIKFNILLAIGLAAATPAMAQGEGGQEVVVTGARMGSNYSNTPVTVIGGLPSIMLTMRRTADFAVQQVTITGDTRDQAKRREEIYAMVRNAIPLAEKSGVQLATGTLVVEPLTLANYKNLPIEDQGGRDDAEQVTFLVKTPLVAGGDAKAALERISRYIASVPAVGRAEMKADGELTLSVVKPEQYRGQIIDMIAKDAAETSAKFGAGYGVEVTGLDRPVLWGRASLTEIFLYLPASYTVRPKN
jgi:hypothetical protein